MKEMRRKKQHLTAEQIEAVIKRNSYGILSLCGSDEQPYGVPLNHVYLDGCLYFHCAAVGQKLDMIAENSKASYCVVDRDVVVPETFSTDFISVIAFGDVEVISDNEEKLRALWAIADTYGVNDHGKKENEIHGSLDHVGILRFRPERMTGKAGMFLMDHIEDFFPELK